MKDDALIGDVRNSIGAFDVRVSGHGIATVVFDKPPVNAVSVKVYEQLGELVRVISASDDIKVVILAAPPDARAWCGGADVNDFVGMESASRKSRYDVINEHVTAFHALDRPVIASMNSHAIGVGVLLAALCDMRVASSEAFVACPEIDYGLIAGGAGLFSWLKMPEGKIREMLYTGRRFRATELSNSGFFNYVVDPEDVFETSWSIAEVIAKKSLPVIRERKVRSNALEGKTWMEAYLEAQRASGRLVELEDAQEGVQAFLQRREADYGDA